MKEFLFITDQYSKIFGYRVLNSQLSLYIGLLQIVVCIWSLTQHIFSLITFNKILYCDFSANSTLPSMFTAVDAIIFDIGLFHSLWGIHGCVAQHLDGGYGRFGWCITHVLTLSFCLPFAFVSRPKPYYLWPLLIQSTYGIGLLILSLAALPRALPTLMGELSNAPIHALAFYLLGTLMNFFLLYIYWHWYWYVETMWDSARKLRNDQLQQNHNRRTGTIISDNTFNGKVMANDFQTKDSNNCRQNSATPVDLPQTTGIADSMERLNNGQIAVTKSAANWDAPLTTLLANTTYCERKLPLNMKPSYKTLSDNVNETQRAGSAEFASNLKYSTDVNSPTIGLRQSFRCGTGSVPSTIHAVRSSLQKLPIRADSKISDNNDSSYSELRLIHQQPQLVNHIKYNVNPSLQMNTSLSLTNISANREASFLSTQLQDNPNDYRSMSSARCSNNSSMGNNKRNSVAFRRESWRKSRKNKCQISQTPPEVSSVLSSPSQNACKTNPITAPQLPPRVRKLQMEDAHWNGNFRSDSKQQMDESHVIKSSSSGSISGGSRINIKKKSGDGNISSGSDNAIENLMKNGKQYDNQLENCRPRHISLQNDSMPYQLQNKLSKFQSIDNYNGRRHSQQQPQPQQQPQQLQQSQFQQQWRSQSQVSLRHRQNSWQNNRCGGSMPTPTKEIYYHPEWGIIQQQQQQQQQQQHHKHQQQHQIYDEDQRYMYRMHPSYSYHSPRQMKEFDFGFIPPKKYSAETPEQQRLSLSDTHRQILFHNDDSQQYAPWQSLTMSATNLGPNTIYSLPMDSTPLISSIPQQQQQQHMPSKKSIYPLKRRGLMEKVHSSPTMKLYPAVVKNAAEKNVYANRQYYQVKEDCSPINQQTMIITNKNEHCYRRSLDNVLENEQIQYGSIANNYSNDETSMKNRKRCVSLAVPSISGKHEATEEDEPINSSMGQGSLMHLPNPYRTNSPITDQNVSNYVDRIPSYSTKLSKNIKFPVSHHPMELIGVGENCDIYSNQSTIDHSNCGDSSSSSFSQRQSPNPLTNKIEVVRLQSSSYQIPKKVTLLKNTSSPPMWDHHKPFYDYNRYNQQQQQKQQQGNID